MRLPGKAKHSFARRQMGATEAVIDLVYDERKIE